jgi:hypothetical protein
MRLKDLVFVWKLAGQYLCGDHGVGSARNNANDLSLYMTFDTLLLSIFNSMYAAKRNENSGRSYQDIS